ncbi:MAG: hypothetical protein ACK5NL_04655 [Vibrio fluvialis]
MKPVWFILFVLLAGCAQHEEQAEKQPENKPPTCVQELSDIDVFSKPHIYEDKFSECKEDIKDDVLVQRYVQALVCTGQFNKLHSPDVFPDNVDGALSNSWTKWIKDNL